MDNFNIANLGDKSVEDKIASLKETTAMISVLENAEKEYLEQYDKYLNSDLDIPYADVLSEEKKVEELKDICAEKLVKAVEKDKSRSGELTLAGAKKLLEPEFREKLKTVLENDKDILSINAVYINRYQVQCSGYQDRPEITQKLFDKMVYQRDETILNLDFKNCYFSGIKLEGTFEGVDFSNCYLSNCKIENAEFKDCNFKNATLSDMEAKNVSFQNTDFEKADLWSSRFENTQFKDVDFTEGNWKSISTVKDTVSFENCNFTITSMNGVYIQGSKIIGEMKNIDTISVTLGGATSQEMKKHEKMIKDTLKSGSARGKEIGKKETLGSERASEAAVSRKPEARKRKVKSR